MAPTAAEPMLISSDTHVVEPPSLWLERLPTALRDRGPQVRTEAEGDYWWVDGARLVSFNGGSQVGQRFDAPHELQYAKRFEDVPLGAYDPAQHLVDNATDRVFGSVLYPTAGLVFYSVPDGDLLSAICAAYNSWLIDFCAYDPARLKGMAMVNVEQGDVAIREMERCHAAGLGGVMFSVFPGPDRPYSDPAYEPLWTAAERLGMPVAMHIGTNRTSLFGDAGVRTVAAAALATQDYWVRYSLASMILSGVFERHPDLRVGSVEFELAWAPPFLDLLDTIYTERPNRPGWHRFADPSVKPSDYFRQNVFVSFQEDLRGLREREHLGMDNLMWGSDFPHIESTFPKSVTILDHLSQSLGLTDDEYDRLFRRNTTELFGFDIPRPTATPTLTANTTTGDEVAP